MHPSPADFRTCPCARLRSHLSPLLAGTFLCLLAHLCAPCVSQAQERFDSSSDEALPLDLLAPVNLKADFLRVVGAPFRMESRQYLTAVGAAGVAASVIAVLDRPVYRGAHQPTSGIGKVPYHLAAGGRAYDRIGPSNAVLGAAGLFAAGGLMFDNNKHLRTSFRMMEALAFTQILTGALKETIGRARPFTGEGPHDADLLDFRNTHAERSMPSGHTSRVFAAASVVAHQYDAWWIKASAYGVATSAGLQRIESGKHWLSDVALGAALGYFVGKTLTDRTRTSAPPTAGSVSYTPVVSSNRIGLSIQF